MDYGEHVLAFVNGVRAVLERDPLGGLAFGDADSDDERECILARAMGCAVGGASDPSWSETWRWVMRFEDRWTARTVGICLEQDSNLEHFEVALPSVLVDFATAAHLGLVESDERGFVDSWVVPRDGDDLSQGFERHYMPDIQQGLFAA